MIPITDQTKEKNPPLRGRRDPRVRRFTKTQGPIISSYIGDLPVCVVGQYSGGLPFGMDLSEYLRARGHDVRYAELDAGGEKFRLHGDQVDGRILLVVDDGINSATTYRGLSSTIEIQKQEHDLKPVGQPLWAVDYDKLGLADFARIRGQDDVYELIGAVLDAVEGTAHYVSRVLRRLRGAGKGAIKKAALKTEEVDVRGIPEDGTSPRQYPSEVTDPCRREFLAYLTSVATLAAAASTESDRITKRKGGEP